MSNLRPGGRSGGCRIKLKKIPGAGRALELDENHARMRKKKQQHSIGLFPAEWHALGEMGAAQGLSATQYAAEALKRHIAERSR